jgi:hypothetical protein
MEPYSELQLPENHPIFPALDEVVEWLKGSDVLEANIAGTPVLDDYLTLENKEAIETRKLIGNSYTARFDNREDFDFEKVSQLSAKVWSDHTGVTDYQLLHVAKTWYPPGGHLGWHKDAPGGRFYATWAEGKSFFRIIHPDTGEVITSWDKPGWTLRTFYTDHENPLWHCVWAQDTRISIGYRFIL